MRHETPTSLRIQKARTALLLDHPFFGSLLFRLKGRESRSVKTMATDGVSLYYNPEFVDTLNAATLAGTWLTRSCTRRSTIMCGVPGVIRNGGM
jgi:predicted metal-dependent peptidase